jgi:assimilatory nitrate reductase catalytic subunit
LERAEFVVVQEAFATAETCAFADLLLPATTWGEKEGTVTNSERRITRVRAAIAPPGQSRHDWQIATDLAAHLLQLPLFQARAQGIHFDYTQPESIWNEHRESTRGRDLDITGLSYAQLEAKPEQWPMPSGATQGRQRLYEDGVFPTPSGKAQFVAIRDTPVADATESRYPFSFNTGRLRDQWHGMTRTGTVAALFGHVPEPHVQMHPQDMLRLKLSDGDLVHITSKRGSIVAPAQASAELAPQQAFMAMHWGSAFISGRDHQNKTLAGVNAITTSAHCPISKQPELKHAAVKILKAELPWKLTAMAWFPLDQAPTVLQQVRAQMHLFEFTSCVPFGQAPEANLADSVAAAPLQGILFRAGASEAPDPAWVHRLEGILQLNRASVLRYADAKRGQFRSIKIHPYAGQHSLQAFILAGDTSAEPWLKALLQNQQATDSPGRRLLMSGAKPPIAPQDSGHIVCACVGVKDRAIQAHLAQCKAAPADRLIELQTHLKCGTQCGSCVPQLKRMMAQQWGVVPAQ